MPCTCVNNTSCNQQKVIQEPENSTPQRPRMAAWSGDTRAASSMLPAYNYMCNTTVTSWDTDTFEWVYFRIQQKNIG